MTYKVTGRNGDLPEVAGFANKDEFMRIKSLIDVLNANRRNFVLDALEAIGVNNEEAAEELFQTFPTDPLIPVMHSYMSNLPRK